MSILSGAHVALTTRTVEALRAADAGDIAVVVGGTIPEADVPKLLSAGAAAVFPTGTPLDTLVRDVRALTEKAGEPDMRLGVMIGAERGDMARKVSKLVADIEWAEAAGLDTAWMPQVPDDFDALTMVALMAAHTSRIELGTAVVPLQAQHPIALARQALSVHAMASGRLALGVGPSHHWIVRDMLGHPLREAGRLHPRLPRGAQRRDRRARVRSTSRTTRSPCTTRPCWAPRRRCRCWSPRSGR